MLTTWDGRFVFSIGFYFLHWLFLWPKVVVPSVEFVADILMKFDMGRTTYWLYAIFGHPFAYWVMMFVELSLFIWLINWANSPDKPKKKPV